MSTPDTAVAKSANEPSTGRPSVIVIGGGLAGLATASALAPRGFAVTILESRGRLGGRAGSFTDPATGQLIDTCQHVSMGCCTNLAHFCRTVGIDHLLRPQPALYFMTADGRVSRFAADRWTAPLHLARSFFQAHYLSAGDKVRIIWGLAALARSSAEDDSPFWEWLVGHRQTRSCVQRFWDVVLTSALNESPQRMGLRYARKVFLDGFLRHRRGFEVELPAVPLGRLYGEELTRWFEEHGVRCLLNHRLQCLKLDADRAEGVELRSGETMRADWYVAAVPFDRLLDVLPAETIEAHAAFSNLKKLETAPITSIHFWFDRPVMTHPHLVLVGCTGQWIFNRGETAPGEHYIQVVVSASRQFDSLGHQEVRQLILEEVKRLLPTAREAELIRSKVVTERAATFSAVPGVDRWRPVNQSPIENLILAGDWTATGWPATMEGAVRSGYLAAEVILERTGKNERLVQPDLHVA
jgi:squalene-associated FAD-dependent desaturase